MFTQRDVLLRLIERFSEAVLEAIRGRSPSPDELVAHAEQTVGLSLDTAEKLTPDLLVSLLSGPDGLDTRRAVLLGLACAARANDEAMAERAVVLIEAAVSQSPDLLTPDVLAVVAALREGPD